MSLIKLVKGDENNLQGRVIVYSILDNIEYEEHRSIFSLYGSIDRKDLIRNSRSSKRTF